MPRKAKYTKEDLVQATLDIIREEGMDKVVARNLGKRLGTGATTIFTHFDTIEDIRTAAIQEILKLYNSYIEEGLSLNPPFKGFGMKFIQFAKDEPNFYKVLFMNNEHFKNVQSVLKMEGHHERLIQVIQDFFNIDEKEANSLYENMFIYGHGIASMIALELCDFSEEEISNRLSSILIGLLMVQKQDSSFLDVIPSKHSNVKVSDIPLQNK